MKKLLVCCTAFLSLWIQPFFAQKAVVERIIEIGHQDNQATHQLDILTNRFGGRPIGSDAYENAAEWMIHEYKKWGLDAQLEEAGELSVGFNRGPWFGKLLSHDHGMTLHFATPSYTSGTKGVQRGHVLMEPRTAQTTAGPSTGRHRLILFVRLSNRKIRKSTRRMPNSEKETERKVKTTR